MDLFPESLQGLLRQTYEPLEIVVLADGADEEAIRVLKTCADPRLRWFSTTQPSGMVKAWNLVCKASKGKYFLFCAHDDVLLDRAIEGQVELMEKHESIGFCHADFTFIDDDGREIDRWVSHEGTWIKRGAEEWPRYVVRTGCCMQATLVRRSMWDEVGGWEEDAGNPGDNSLYLKLLRVGDVGHVSNVVCKYRLRIRTPDSWQKRFQNLREHHRLSTKHLATPLLASSVAPKIISQQLSSRLSQMAIPLLSSAPDQQSQQELRIWLRQNVWRNSAFGRFCCIADKYHAAKVLELGLRNQNRLRAIARNLVGASLRGS